MNFWAIYTKAATKASAEALNWPSDRWAALGYLPKEEAAEKRTALDSSKYKIRAFADEERYDQYMELIDDEYFNSIT